MINMNDSNFPARITPALSLQRQHFYAKRNHNCH
ncbi:MAG TPA: hypothetical protein DEB17_07795 [Chlorobaculum sp.]|uniref:Uncharacterized protein n=1 Tax=Chlorobaculum tepidum (strain ATCC 49652 / DSM 12025 / NBRC 103806 / TLS) TaxID=194439 RepID=Q8KFC2_CHLTE|nr:hypothetical protein CT0405 [Chlorobaculum tepidum TLS]HBU23875.1 hypothetical protein [Chlorobaculum sp.]